MCDKEVEQIENSSLKRKFVDGIESSNKTTKRSESPCADGVAETDFQGAMWNVDSSDDESVCNTIVDRIRSDTQSQSQSNSQELDSQPQSQYSSEESDSIAPTPRVSVIKSASHLSLSSNRNLILESMKYENAVQTKQRKSLRRDENVQVLFDTDTIAANLIGPWPKAAFCDTTDQWNRKYVRMPYSTKNTMRRPRTNIDISRWPIIQTGMKRKIRSTDDLEEVIKSYNPKVFNVSLLHTYFKSEATLEERERFFDVTLPKMQQMMLNMPNVITMSPKLLLKNENSAVYMTQEQCAHILVAAFFCTFPRRNKARYVTEYDDFNAINFDRLFRNKDNIEKLKTLLNYFHRITDVMPNGVISFERCVQQKPFPEFETATDKLQPVTVTGTGFIEREGEEYVQVDFANCYIGGGVLGRGCVQEEIRFLISPELIASMLITEMMETNECVIITGAEMFSEYSGYADTYKYKGNKIDSRRRDLLMRKMTQIVAMDAAPYYDDKLSQYSAQNIYRDLQKAYIAFNSTNPNAAIATGNWGCGAFGGDSQLKFLIQLMAAAIAKKPLMYFTCDGLMSTPLSEELQELKLIVSHHDVSSIYRRLMDYECEFGPILNHFRHPDFDESF